MKPVELAPMAGVTDKAFRKMVRLFGQQRLHTEMIGVESLVRRHPATCKMMNVKDEENVVVQLVGERTDAFSEATRMAEQAGAVGIDINMGCPVKKLISNGSGAALMKTPDVAARIVECVKQATTLPVSVKTRLGWDMSHINVVSFAQLMANAGADKLTIHARTKEQGYSGLANWDMVRQVKESVSIPVFINGDIVDKTSAEQALSRTQADGISVGRGALGKPWLLSELETGEKPDINMADLICRHLDLMLAEYGAHGVYVARKHLAWYASGQKNVAQFRQKVYAETNVEKIKEMIYLFFKEVS